MKESDAFGVSGKVWHLKRRPKKDKKGNIAVSIAVVPGGNPRGSWLIVIMREFRERRRFMPTSRIHEHSALEFLIGVLATQPLDMDLSLKKYPHNNPIVVLVQFPSMSSDLALQLFDAAILMLIDGYLSPNQSYLIEWQLFLLTTMVQISKEENDIETAKVIEKTIFNFLPQ
jgi:hypothetical protein